MRTILSIQQTADLPAMARALRASRARLADAIVTGDELSLSLEYSDTANVELKPAVPGASAGVVPLLEARLMIHNVLTASLDVSPDAPLGHVDIDYDHSISACTLKDAAGSSIKLTVSALDASIETTDRRIGQQQLASLM